MTKEEAIRRIKAWNLDADDMEVLSEVIPELKENENEDERIRKELLEHCKNQAKPYIYTGNKCPQIQSWIAYLEKQKECGEANFREGYLHGFEDAQKEQKPKKFKLGDKIRWHDGDTDVITITGFRNDAYLTDSAYGPILFCDEDNWERIGQNQCIYGDTPSVERCAVCSAKCDIRVREDKQKPEAKLTGWVARDSEYNPYFGLGLILFNKKPQRSGDCWDGEISSHLPWELFPDLKWEDEPVEVEVTIKRNDVNKIEFMNKYKNN